MKKPPAYWYTAKRILSKRDPILRKIIKKKKQQTTNRLFKTLKTLERSMAEEMYRNRNKNLKI